MSDAPRQLPGEAGGPRSVAEARRVVESQRERISATIDELEEKLVEKRAALRDRLDVARPVREFTAAKPLLAVGIAAGAGLLLGLLSAGSGGDDDEEERIYVTNEPPEASRVGRLLRDMAHEIAGAATALLVAQMVERVSPPED